MKKWVNKTLSFAIAVNTLFSIGAPIYTSAQTVTQNDELAEETTVEIDNEENSILIEEENEDLTPSIPEENEEMEVIDHSEVEEIHNDGEELVDDIEENELVDVEESNQEPMEADQQSNDLLEDTVETEEIEKNETTEEQTIETFSIQPASTSNSIQPSDLRYRAHVQSIGWQNWVGSGHMGGTTGKGLRVEALNIDINHSDLGVRYRTRNQNSNAWSGWVQDGALSGTTGQQKHLESIQVELTGKEATNFDIYYRVHSRAFGWLGWAKNGEASGTEGYNYRIESMEMQLVRKGDKAPGQNTLAYQKLSSPNLSYEAHVQSNGWLGSVKDGQIAGVNNNSLRLEAFRANVNHSGLNIRYRSKSVGNDKWSHWSSNGEITGTMDKALPIESIQIELTGSMANHFDVYYRVKAEQLGWLGWAKRGETAGTEWYDYQLEAIELKIVPRMNHSITQTSSSFESNPMPVLDIATHVQKNGWINGFKGEEVAGTIGKTLRTEAFTINLKNKNISGGIEYRAHVEKEGWQPWRRDGQVAGTEGQAKRVEAIEVRLYGELAKHYDVYYSSHIESYGWLGLVKNGMSSGSKSFAKRLEAFEIMIRPKNKPVKLGPNDGFKRPPIVYLDAGHGGRDPGATHRNVTEASLNFSVTLKIEQLLKQRGYDVRMSRKSDIHLELHERSGDANKQKPDIIVSVHHNAMGRPNSGARGIETFIHHRVASGYGQETNRNNFRTDHPRIADSLRLADSVHKHLINRTGLVDRGVKGNNFHMVREPNMPAILLELGFVDNDAELARIRTASFQNSAARAVADGIDEYFGNW